MRDRKCGVEIRKKWGSEVGGGNSRSNLAGHSDSRDFDHIPGYQVGEERNDLLWTGLVDL
jgi:hypothetical protein